MVDYIMENNNAEMDIVMQYANEAGQTLRNFSEQVMIESDKSYEVLCNMDSGDNE